jgi:catechol 2,3-dioxygenase-like lactoylglutathione lyase family enzyme
MITGTHTIIYSKDAEADKAFFRDILKLEKVDVGRGWLIFGLPPSELAVHPTEDSQHQGFYLMCDDINAFVKQMSQHKIVCSEVSDQRWGLLIELTLPGGGKVGVYQPKHERPKTNLKMA